MDTIEKPVASAVVRWRTADEGGRHSGPPTAPVYMTTAVFALGSESEVQPEWPFSADPMLSILLEKTGELDDGRWSCQVGFLAPDLARPYLHPGAELLVLEGARTVAVAHITEVVNPEQSE